MIVSSDAQHREAAFRVAIAGGGFSGAAVAYHLARRWRAPIEIAIAEPRPAIGRGVAYSAPGEHLLLNVPAGKLSIDPDVPGDFYHWSVAQGHAVQPGDFLPRALFGAYTEERLTQIIVSTRGRVTLRRVTSAIERIEEGDGARVLAARDGTLIDADHVVLALGNGPTRVPASLQPFAFSDRVLLSPFDADAMTRVAASARQVLLVGTGLTMCDAAISLARLGYRGTMTAISPKGRLPAVHSESNPAALVDWRDGLQGGSLRELVRAVRKASVEHGWRSAIDALRPRTSQLWASLSPLDQRRFMMRVASYWDTARHRQPHAVASAIDVLRDSGALRILRGMLGQVRDHGAWLSCEIDGRSQSGGAGQGGFNEVVHADAVILCTGPEADPARWGSPLFRRLLADGIVCRDALGLGLRTTDDGFLVGRGGVVDRRLSTIGSLRRGSLWESTAVPELSQQAADLAAAIDAEYHDRFWGAVRSSGSVEERIRKRT